MSRLDDLVHYQYVALADDRTHPSYCVLELMVLCLWQDFAQSGLRTLCLAVKDIDPQLYERWRVKHHEARYGQSSPLSIHIHTQIHTDMSCPTLNLKRKNSYIECFTIKAMILC